MKYRISVELSYFLLFKLAESLVKKYGIYESRYSASDRKQDCLYIYFSRTFSFHILPILNAGIRRILGELGMLSKFIFISLLDQLDR